MRTLHVDQGCTWCQVAAACAFEWGDEWGSNQVAGMELCERAAARLAGRYMGEPWN